MLSKTQSAVVSERIKLTRDECGWLEVHMPHGPQVSRREAKALRDVLITLYPLPMSYATDQAATFTILDEDGGRCAVVKTVLSHERVARDMDREAAEVLVEALKSAT